MADPLIVGNIDLRSRPIVKNPDGSYSTVRSMSFQDEKGREVLVPTISPDGRNLTNQQAIERYYRTGEHLGIFANPLDADTYARTLHEQQQGLYDSLVESLKNIK